MTKKEYERINELLKQDEYYFKIIDALVKGKKYILLVKTQNANKLYEHSLNEEEIDTIFNWFQSKRDEIYIQLKELGYYD